MSDLLASLGRIALTIGFSTFGGGALAHAAWSTVGSLLGGLLFPQKSLKGPLAAASLQVSGPQKGQPLPVVYGRTRLTANLIWYGNFTAGSEDAGGGKGGKGGGGSVPVYSADCAFAISEGVVQSLRRIWLGDSEKMPADITHTFYSGTGAQTVDAYLAAALETDQQTAWLGPAPPGGTPAGPAFPYTAYVIFPQLSLGYGSNMPAISFEVERYDLTDNDRLDATLLVTHPYDADHDMNPALIIADFLTHTRYGLSVLASDIDWASFIDAANFCHNNGLYISPILAQNQDGLRHIEELLTYFDGMLVYSQGQLHLKVRSQPATTIPITPDDYMEGAAATLSRQGIRDAKNTIRIEWQDRANGYGTAVTEAKDGWVVGRSGANPEQISLPAFKTRTPTERMAGRMLLMASTPTIAIKLGLAPREFLIEPGDVLEVTDPSLDLDHQYFRVVSVSEDKDGSMAVSAVLEYPEGLELYGYSSEPGAGTVGTADLYGDPGDAVVTVVETWQHGFFGQGSFVVHAGSHHPSYAGSEVHVSVDGGNTFAYAGRTTTRSAQGATLTLLLAGGADLQPAATVEVDIGATGGTLESTTAAGLTNEEKLVNIEDEVIAYQTATLIAANQYRLTGLYRGRQSTARVDHGIGSSFCYLNPRALQVDFPATLQGETVVFKVASINHAGEAQDLAAVPVVNHLVDALIAPIIGDMTIDGNLALSGILDFGGPQLYGLDATHLGIIGSLTIDGAAIWLRNNGYAQYSIDSADAAAGTYSFTSYRRYRGTIAAPTAVQNGDWIGGLRFGGYDGAAIQLRGGIFALVDGAVAAGVVPTAISLRTGTASLIERFRISSAGLFTMVGLPAYANNAAAVGGGLTVGQLYRTGGDPDIVCVVH
ncbi:MAG: phage tail protein [bacterium]